MYTSMDFQQVKPILKTLIQANANPFLLGRAGIGKSSAARSLAPELNAEVFTLQINQMVDRSDLTGQRPDKIKDKDGNEKNVLSFFPNVEIQRAIDFAQENPDKLAIIFLDEINRANADVTSAALSLITERRLGSIILPDNVRFIAAGNDTGNVIALDEASRTRFLFLRVHPDAETLLTVIPNLNPYVKDAILKRPDLVKTYGLSQEMNPVQDPNADPDDIDDLSLFTDEDEQSFSQHCNPRTIENLSKFLNQAGLDKTQSAIEKATLMSLMNPSSDDQTIIEVIVEGAIGQGLLADLIVEQIKDAYSDVMRTTTTSTALLNSYPSLDIQTFNHIVSATDVTEEANRVASLTPIKRNELLASLFLNTTVNNVNDLATTTRVIDHILTMNDPLELAITTQIYQLAQQAPNELSNATVSHALKAQTQTLQQIAPALTQAISI